LKQELSICEQELQQLRVAYVELLMNSEDLHAQPPIHPLASACNYFSEGLQLGMQPGSDGTQEGSRSGFSLQDPLSAVAT